MNMQKFARIAEFVGLGLVAGVLLSDLIMSGRTILATIMIIGGLVGLSGLGYLTWWRVFTDEGQRHR